MKRVPAGIPWNNNNKGRKDRDEADLVLFRELHKREKDRIATLLQPMSDEFDPNHAPGNYALYRIASGKKGSGYELFAENNDKNDYDWLKTPPATPLFPSLEMEATAPELVVQREIPILQPLSRFAGNNSEASKGKPKSPNPKPKIPPRSITPSQLRPSNISSTETKNTTKEITPVLNQIKTSQLLTTTDLNNNKRTTNYGVVTNTTKSTHQHLKDFLNSNLSKNMASGGDSKTKPRSRGVSPSVRSSTIPAQIPGFSNETPPNLRTDRSTSATRGRPGPGNPTVLTVSHQKPEPTPINPRRQSCSPSVTRGRKVEPIIKQESQKGRNIQTQFLGSRMVDKVMNARKSGVEEKQPKSRNGFGGIMSKTSLDMPHKHMEIKRDRINSRNLGIVPGRISTRE